MGELAAAGTAVLWAMSSMLFTLGGRRIGAESVNLIRLYFGMFFILITHWCLVGVPVDMEVEGWRHAVLLVSAFVGLVIGDGALFYAFVLIGARLSMLIMSLVPVFSAVFAFICFGESLSTREFAAICFSVLAIAYVVGENRKDENSNVQGVERSNFILGVVMSLVGVLGQTGNLIITKYALVDNFSTLSATEIRILYSMLILTIWAILRGQLGAIVSHFRDRKSMLIIAAGAFVGPFVGIWLSYIAINETRVAIASVIMATPPLLLIPLSAYCFGEKMTVRSVVGTVFAFLGIAGLIWLQGGDDPESTKPEIEKTQSTPTQVESATLG